MTFICAQMHEQNYNLFDIRHGPAVTHLQLKPSISKVPSVYISEGYMGGVVMATFLKIFLMKTIPVVQ